MHLLPTIVWLLGLSALATAVITDLKNRTIPNEVAITVASLGLLLQLATGGTAVWMSIAAALATFLPLALLAQADVVGGGDAKLIPAVTLLVPPQHIALLLMNISLAGGLLAGAFLAARALRRPAVAFQAKGAERIAAKPNQPPSSPGELMPYALAIFAGTAYSILIEAASCSSAISCSL